MTTHRHVLPLVAGGCALAAAAVALAGCAPVPASGGHDAVAIVLAPTMGGSALAPADLDAPLQALDAEGDRLVAVVADGSPYVAVDVTVPELPGNAVDRDDWLTAFRAQMRSSLLAKVASSPEVDSAEAVSLAATAFDGVAPETRRSLYDYSSGITTSGALSMLDGRLYAEPTDLVAHAADSGIPDLRSVAVTMPKLGVVTDPQPALTESARGAVTAIWAAYFARAGATDVQLSPTSLLARPVSTNVLPHVTPVPVERPLPAAAAECRQEVGDASIGFAAGSADLTDPTAARVLLARTVSELSTCPGSYRVDGSASSEGESPEANRQLSLARSQAVAAVLAAETGTPVSDMTITGWGVTWPCRVPDLTASGALILDAAIANRTVVISKGDPGVVPKC